NQQAAEDAPRHGGHDEDDGRRQTWPARRPRPGDGIRLRHAVARADGGNGETNARRPAAAEHAGRRRLLAAGHAEAAPEHARPAWPGRKVPRIAGRPAARTRKEEVSFDL